MKGNIDSIKNSIQKIGCAIKTDKKKRIIAIALLLVLLVVVVRSCNSVRKSKVVEDVPPIISEDIIEDEPDYDDYSEDALLLAQQPDLVKAYGKLPEGYIWSSEGELLSLGDASLSAEDVVYAYLNGLRTLDFSTAQKFSRGSKVIETYEGYFDTLNKNTDYFDAFVRAMYKQVLLSMQVKGISDSSVFAENKQVFTVNVELLDLTNKDFWEKDKKDIYKNLYIYASDEDDSAKSDMYLYDYVLGYYQSKKAKTREVSINLTVQRYPDLNTGWLVSIDNDVNDACVYSDGTLMVNYIRQMYSNEGKEYVLQEKEKEKGDIE